MVGDTVIDDPDKLPGCHAYVEAPVAEIVVEAPQATEVEVALVETVGAVLFTVTSIVLVAVHPLLPVTVTV